MTVGDVMMDSQKLDHKETVVGVLSREEEAA